MEGIDFWQQKGKKDRITGRTPRGDYGAWLRSQEGEIVYKNTFNAQTHVDVRDMALLDRFLRTLSWNPTGMSDLIRTSLEMVLNAARRDGIPEMESTEEAYEYLANHGYRMGQFSKGSKQERRLNRALQRDELIERKRYGIEECEEDVVFHNGKTIRIREEDEYDNWGRSLVAQLVRDGMSRMDADADAGEQAKKRRHSPNKEDHWTVWEYYYQRKGATPATAQEKAKKKVDELFRSGEVEKQTPSKTPKDPEEEEIAVSGDNIAEQARIRQAREKREHEAMKNYMLQAIEDAKRRGQTTEPSE